VASEEHGHDEIRMRQAIGLAEQALRAGDFPVGCVLVHGDAIVGEGYRIGSFGPGMNELDHAEIRALRDWYGKGAVGRGRDPGLSVYCTLEPCLMCLGALLLNGVRRIVFAYEDVMGGACGIALSGVGSASDGISSGYGETLYGSMDVAIRGGILRSESLALFRAFFSNPSSGYWRGSPLARHVMGNA